MTPLFMQAEVDRVKAFIPIVKDLSCTAKVEVFDRFKDVLKVHAKERLRLLVSDITKADFYEEEVSLSKDSLCSLIGFVA